MLSEEYDEHRAEIQRRFAGRSTNQVIRDLGLTKAPFDSAILRDGVEIFNGSLMEANVFLAGLLAKEVK